MRSVAKCFFAILAFPLASCSYQILNGNDAVESPVGNFRAADPLITASSQSSWQMSARPIAHTPTPSPSTVEDKESLAVMSFLGFFFAIVAWIGWIALSFSTLILFGGGAFVICSQVLKRSRGVKFKGKWMAKVGLGLMLALFAVLLYALVAFIISLF